MILLIIYIKTAHVSYLLPGKQSEIVQLFLYQKKICLVYFKIRYD